MPSADVIVIGGGLVGASIAWGMARQGAAVIILDEGDTALRASRGNFGLVWVQGKGRGCPQYAQWSLRSADLWGDFAAELKEQTGVDVGHQRPGGVLLNLTPYEHEASTQTLAQIRSEAQNKPYEYEFYDGAQLRELLPGVGEDVVSGSYSRYDGHVNPLYLLRALHTGFVANGGRYMPSNEVVDIAMASNSSVVVKTTSDEYHADKVVISAGLATQGLASKVNLNAPIKPLHGQILVTERSKHKLELPTNIVRQTREGAFMLGYTVDDFGYDNTAHVDRSRDVAARTLKAFPFLRDLRIVRSWAAIRIMTSDGFPIYDASQTHEGVYVATCHSGVTLAAVHARDISRWVLGLDTRDEVKAMTTRRFNVPETA